MRILYAITSLLFLLSVHPFLDLFFGPQSVCMPLTDSWLYGIVSSSWATPIWYFAFLNSLFLLLGIQIRLTAILQFFFLAIFFSNDCRAYNYGDQIFVSTAFLMIFFLPSDETSESKIFPIVCRLFVGTLYLVPILVRIPGDTWWNGTASWIALLDPLNSRVGSWINKEPQRLPAWFFYGITYGSMLFEGTFPFLIWIRRLRKPLVILGLVFHGVMGVVMELGLFPLQMAILLVGCLSKGETIFSSANKPLDPTTPARHQTV